MDAAVRHDIGTLLAEAGARPAGPRRYDCPECGSRRTVSVDEGRGLFHCHHAGCGFSGGVGTLRKRLGLRREWLPRAEYVRQRKERERVHDAAQRLARAVHARRVELLDSLSHVNRLEALIHDAGPSEASWEVLALVYAERSGIVAELAVLESASAADLVRFFTADAETRQHAIERVIERGGLYDFDGKWVESGV